MKTFKSLAVNRWITALLCLSLLVSILTTSSGSFLHRVYAQRTGTLDVGEKLGPNLPDLSHIRYKAVTQPKAPEMVGSSNACLDCTEPRSLGNTFSEARLDPRNRTGEPGVDLFSQNTRWSEPLINFTGRSRLDLNLSLVYNSLVWTTAGSDIAFDADRGQPSPGFRLGFPTIQPRFLDTETGTPAFLLITPEGKRVELRQRTNGNVYESVDNSSIRMIDNGSNGAIVLRPDGTRLNFKWVNGQLQVVQVQDRNGNYITSDYDSYGHLKNITDTVGRTFSFVRDNGGNLVSIRQRSAGTEDRTIATFSYADLTIQTNFSGLKVIGPSNGSRITVLTQVGVPDGSHYQFDYTSWGQVWKITKFAPDGHALTYVSYNLPQDATAALTSSPRATELHNWIEGENNNAEAITRFDIDSSLGSAQLSLPDTSVRKEFFATSGWERGLTKSVEEWSGNLLQKRTRIEYTQDDTALSYPVNPRQQDVISEDSQGHTTKTHTEYTSFGLPTDTSTVDDSGPVRRVHIEYDFNSEYVQRHILSLVRERTVYGQGGALISKTTYEYDASGSIVDQGQALQHDGSNYGSNFLVGRGLLTAITALNAKSGKSKVSYLGYNTNGSLAFRRDDSGQQINFSYSDNFADQRDRHSMAFVTASTGSGSKRSTVQYDYSTGAPVRTESWQGVVQTFSYDNARRLTGTTDSKAGASMRRIYDENGSLIATFRKMGAQFKELGTYTVLDGVGRVRAKAIDPLSKAGGYRGIYVNRDIRGRVINQTKQTKMSSAWILAEPVALNTTDSAGQPPSAKPMLATLVAGLSDVLDAIEPTASAQGDCPPGYYCTNDPSPDVEWGTMDCNGIGDSVDIDGVTYSVSVSYQPEAVQVSLINDGGVQTDWGAQFAIAGLLEAFMGAFEEVGGAYAEEYGTSVEGEVADTVGEVAPDANKLSHIFDNPAHNLDPVVSAYGTQTAAFQAIQQAVQTLGMTNGLFEVVVNVAGFNVTVRGNVINGIAYIGTAYR